MYWMGGFILLAGRCIFGGVCGLFASKLRLGSDGGYMIQHMRLMVVMGQFPVFRSERDG